MSANMSCEVSTEPIINIGAEENFWQIQIDENQDKAIFLGKLENGEYYTGTQKDIKNNTFLILDYEEAIDLRLQHDDIYEFRQTLVDGFLDAIENGLTLSQANDGSLYKIEKTERKIDGNSYPIFYLLQILKNGEMYLTHDSDLYGERSSKSPGNMVEMTYTYHISAARNIVGRVIFPNSEETKMRYRRQDYPFYEYCEHVASNLKPFGIDLSL